MSTLTKDIHDSINANLPSMIGAQLREALEKADRDAAKLVSANEYISKLEAEKKTLAETIKDLSKKVMTDEELRKREEEVAKREIRQEIADLKVKLTEDRLKDLKEVTLAVFANNHFKYGVTTTDQVVVPPGGSMSYPQVITVQNSKSVEGSGG